MSCTETYQANTLTYDTRKNQKDRYDSVKAFHQSLTFLLSLIESIHLVLKYSQDVISGVAGGDLVGKWMRSEILTSPVLVFLQGGIEYG
jgi:hypothetical protein